MAPEWKHQVSERLEQFRHKRAQQRALFSPEEETGEEAPRPRAKQKVLAFEDFAQRKIEPVIVERARKAAQRQAAPELPPLVEEVTVEEPVAREVACDSPVAPLTLRTLAAILDAAVLMVAIGIFFGTFHLLGGSLHFNHKAAAGLLLAGGSMGAFYLFLYIGYAGETPGLQWTGLCILAFGGNHPHFGQRLVRAAGTVLSGAALGLGHLWAIADEEGLTWHDRMSKTFVTRDPQARRHFKQRGQ